MRQYVTKTVTPGGGNPLKPLNHGNEQTNSTSGNTSRDLFNYINNVRNDIRNTRQTFTN